MTRSQKTESIERRPPLREHYVGGEPEKFYSLIECHGIDIEAIANRRGMTVSAVFAAYRVKARNEAQALARRAKLSVMPPHNPSPAKRAA